jgi:hypothetical protein
MKRQLVVEIDCGSEYCEDCAYLTERADTFKVTCALYHNRPLRAVCDLRAVARHVRLKACRLAESDTLDRERRAAAALADLRVQLEQVQQENKDLIEEVRETARQLHELEVRHETSAD